MVTIGIAGAHSGCGKTAAACMLLRELRGWGAIKCTREGLYASVIDDPAVLTESGKDTARMLEAGAAEALWVRASREEMPEALDIAVPRMAHLDGVIVEGNRGVEVLNPDIVIFVMGSGGLSGVKQGAEGLLARAHVLLYDGEPPEAGQAAPPYAMSDPAWVGHVKAELRKTRS